MAAGAFVVHDKVKERMGNGVINFDTDTFKVVLCASTSNAATASLEAYASLTNELSTANGYTAGGVTVSPTWTESSGTVTFDIADPSWTASGGSIVARFAVIYDDTVSSPVAKPIIAHCLLDSAPADVTTTTGNTLTIQISSSGVFSVT